jgi:RNA polymerase sigma-70 factor, ECF subfamily
MSSVTIDDSVPCETRVREIVADVYRSESRRVFATLVRLLGDFDLAEEMLHEAFTAAVERWPTEGIPENPRTWLVSAGRFKGIDALRRRSRFDESLGEIARREDVVESAALAIEDDRITDDRLRLIFTCCHPALAHDAQVALTLREVCGLTTEEIAAAFLVAPATMAQRIVRGKAKIREAGIPYQMPVIADMPERLESVLSVCYLVFNEGYSASSGESLTRPDLSGEAIRLGRLICELLPDSETFGLLALMLLHESRRTARTSDNGDIVLLEDQDRSLWNRELIGEAIPLIHRALASGPVGPYTIQAAISAVHAESPNAASTDWQRIVEWYDLLMQAAASPVVELNRAVAVAMRDGPQAGLALIASLLERGELASYHLLHAARADLFRRLGQTDESAAAYRQALSLAKQEPERRYLERRLREIR